MSKFLLIGAEFISAYLKQSPFLTENPEYKNFVKTAFLLDLLCIRFCEKENKYKLYVAPGRNKFCEAKALYERHFPEGKIKTLTAFLRYANSGQGYKKMLR